MKDKIIGILQKEMFNITTEAGDAYSVVEEDDFKEIAEMIVKLFAIPVVVNPVCPNCLSEMHTEKHRVYKCSNCSTEY